jgi:hypothetical protein
MNVSLPLFVLSFGALGYVSISGQGMPARQKEINFGRDIKPILSQHCLKCHGPDASKAAAAATLPSDQKVALAASAPEVQQIVTTREIAQAAGPVGDGAKVVSKP